MKLTCIIVFVAITSSLNACPPGTIPGPNPQICYKFINDSLTWLGADQECISQEGNGVKLTSVENAILNQFLLNGAVNAFGTSDRFWLGSTTLLDGSTWSWSDGSNSDYTNWAPGEPKNTNGSYCVSSSVQRGGKWFSESCLSKHPYICEFLFSEVQENNCPDQWTYFSYTDKCYRFVTDEEIDDSFNFNSGREKCKSFDSNADLAIIRDFNENTLVSGLSINGIIDSGLINKGVCGKDNIVTDCCVMIGLSKVNFTWQWVDGTNANYTNWLPGEPDSNAPYVNLLVGVQLENQWQSGYGCKNIMCQLNPAVINSSQNLKRSSFAKIF